MTMKDLLIAAATTATLATTPQAQPLPEPIQTYAEGDLVLESREAIKNFSIAYVTHGTLNAEKSNAILVLTAIGANHHRLDYLIGSGKALDTDRYFIIATNAIGNGLTTSPSNSRSQPRLSFPRFGIRDMVESQYRLVTEHLGIRRLCVVVGVSMGGMQALQWGVSHPDTMKSLVAIVPLGRTPAWTRVVMALTRQQIISDPAWLNGTYSKAPEAGMRLRVGTMALITRTPQLLENDLPNRDAEAWLQKTQKDTWNAVEAVDWVYQSWAYDAHDVGTTSGFHGDTAAALQSIRARTLILAGGGDLLNPESEARAVALQIPRAEFQLIEPRFPLGHYSASGKTQPEVDVQNHLIAEFLNRELR